MSDDMVTEIERFFTDKKQDGYYSYWSVFEVSERTGVDVKAVAKEIKRLLKKNVIEIAPQFTVDSSYRRKWH